VATPVSNNTGSAASGVTSLYTSIEPKRIIGSGSFGKFIIKFPEHISNFSTTLISSIFEQIYLLRMDFYGREFLIKFDELLIFIF